jgi:pyridoxal phosphate enzyme (YggS family)
MATDLESPANLKDAYDRVCQRIEAAAAKGGRRAADVLLVAVSKYASLDQLRALIELGHGDFGESRAQQLTQRAGQLNEFLSRKRTLGCEDQSATQLPERLRWHMVGHLQRNKIKQVCPLVDLIHSLDTLRLAEELHNYAAERDEVIDILIQVNASSEPSKYGIAPPAVIHLAEQINTMLHLRLRGLMTMAPYAEDPEQVRGVFAHTRELFEELRTQSFVGNECNILSMGMSNDFEVAIEEGANVVRVGSALFGSQES